MRLKFETLDSKFYWITLEKYKALPFRKVSEFQLKWKRFFMNLYPRDFWCEEFLVRPLLSHKYRLDFLNFSRKVAFETHGAQHVATSDHFHKGSQDTFLDALVKDREKELWCEKNNIHLVTVYTSTPMEIDFFKKKYPKIRW